MLKNHVYYCIRPLVPRKLQIFLRRLMIARKREKYKGIWPIDERAKKSPEAWKGWPDNKKFALVLTHDVETGQGQDKCYELMKLEEELGFRSSFGFVAEEYRVRPEIRHSLVSRGFEVNMHGLNHDGKLYRS